MILLTLRDLRYRAVRFVVVVLLATVVFALLFLMTGLVEQFNREPFDAVDAIGATTWVLPEGVSGPFTASTAIPLATAAAVRADGVSPIVTARSSLSTPSQRAGVIVVGFEEDGLGAPPITDGRSIEGPGELVVDDSVDVDTGDTVDVGGRDFEIVGRTTDATMLAGLPLVFMATTDAQDVVFGSRDVVSAVLANGDVGALPDGLVALSSVEVAADALVPLEGAVASVDFVRVLLWIVAAVIVGAVVYLSALERQRDFAVLKAVGTSNRTLLASLALQAVLVAIAAVALAAVLQIFLAPAFPLRVRVPASAFWQLPLLAVAMALLASLAGMRRVVRSDPALAFAGAGA